MQEQSVKVPGRDGPRWWPYLLLGGLGLLYAVMLPVNFTEAEDAVYYAWRVDEGAPLWHPNHLIFEPLSYGFCWILSSLGLAASAAQAMQIQSLMAATLTLVLLYHLIRDATGEDGAASFAVLATGGSFGFWHYSGLPDTYILPLPAVIGALILFRGMATQIRLGGVPGWGRAGALGLLVALATLIHQSHVFLFMALFFCVLGLVLRVGPARKAAMVARFLVFLLGFGLPVAFGYFGVGFGLLGHNSPFETIAWSRGFASDGLWTPLSLLTPVKAVIGFATAVWSPLFLFAEQGLVDLVEAVFPGRQIVEERHFAGHGLRVAAGVIAALTLISVAAGIALLGRALWLRADYSGLSRPVLFVWVFYTLAAAIWEPANKEFWIVALPLTFTLVAIHGDLTHGWARVVAPIFLLGLFAANYAGAIDGLRRAEADYWRVSQASLIQNTAPGDAVIDHCGYICTGYLLLLAPAEIYDNRAITDIPTVPGRIFVTERALRDFTPLGWPEWLPPRPELPLIFGAGDLQSYEILPPT